MNNLPRIYLDMDGVLFDFVKNIEQTTGLSINQWTNLGRKERWDPIIAKKDFWSKDSAQRMRVNNSTTLLRSTSIIF